MLSSRQQKLSALLFLCVILLTGCSSSMLKKSLSRNINEQLYVDARLDFAIKHPMDWKLAQTPVSSPLYRADTVRWQVNGLKQEHDTVGEMLIQSRPADADKQLEDLLTSYLSGEAELLAGRRETFDHPSGPALKLFSHDDQQDLLTIALKGQERDFIISFAYPPRGFAKLRPVFQDIVSSFTEVVNSEPPGK